MVSHNTEISGPRRRYRMDNRAAAAQRTREAILEATEALFAERPFEDLTIAEIAAAAGVSQQTVVNHFGTKERLILVGIQERVGPRIEAHRAQVRVGDLDSIVEIVVSDYELTGAGTLRLLAAADRFPAMAESVAYGRAFHHGWVRSVLAPQLERMPEAARDDTARLLAVVLDVRTWAQLRHDDGRSAEETRRDLRRMLEALLHEAGAG
jgi:AcrR family transcriptional regulator